MDTSSFIRIATACNPPRPELPQLVNHDLSGNAKDILNEAEKGNAAAQNMAGKMYRDGADGIEKDDKQAAIWFMKAEKSNPDSKEATENLHALFLEGRGIQTNAETQSRALQYLMDTAAGNSSDAPKAQYQYGVLLKDANLAQARLLFIKVMNAKVPELLKNDALKQLVDSYCCAGIRSEEALPYFKMAADKLKHVDAAFAYAESFNTNERYMVNEAREQLYYYKTAADQGHPLAEFRCKEIAALKDVETNTSFDWSEIKFTTTSNREEIARIRCEVGIAYFHGDKEHGVLPNRHKAEYFLSRSKSGLANYLLNDLVCLNESLDYPFDKADTNENSARAARHSARDDNFLPAILEARAIEKNDMEAAFELYQQYRNGDYSFLGIPPNPAKSEFFFNLALENHYLPALKEFAKDVKNEKAKAEFSHIINSTKTTELPKSSKLKRKEKELEIQLKSQAYSKTNLDPSIKLNVATKPNSDLKTTTSTTTLEKHNDENDGL